MAPLMRMTRASMLGVLSSDFIRTARASGLPRSQVLYAYAFRNALLPVVTTLGMVFSFLLGSNVLVEKVFAWPGIGSYVIEALVSSDYAPVQGFVLTMALWRRGMGEASLGAAVGARVLGVLALTPIDPVRLRRSAGPGPNSAPWRLALQQAGGRSAPALLRARSCCTAPRLPA